MPIQFSKIWFGRGATTLDPVPMHPLHQIILWAKLSFAMVLVLRVLFEVGSTCFASAAESVA